MTLTDLITYVLPIAGRIETLNGITIADAANAVIGMIADKLLERESDLLATGQLDLLIDALDYQAPLPEDFISMAEKPKLHEVVVIVQQYTEQEHGHILEPQYMDEDDHGSLIWWNKYGPTGVPEYNSRRKRSYKIIGDTIYVRPTCTQVTAIKGRYNQYPSLLENPSDIIPWSGKFDHVVREGTVRIVRSGDMGLDSDVGFLAMFNRSVNGLINARVGIVRDKGRISRRAYI